MAAQLSEHECEAKLGLRKLTFSAWWVQLREHSCLEGADTAPLVLAVCGRELNAADDATQADVLERLRTRRCVFVDAPGSDVDGSAAHTMLLPSQAYLASETMTSLAALQLPIARGLDSVPHALLVSLGMRAHPPVALVRDRMGELDWGFRELVAYLERREMSGDLGPEDWAELEAEATSRADAPTRYLPTDELGALGLPTISWSGASMSEVERRLLVCLGVAERPPLPELLAKASGAGCTEKVRKAALAFLIREMATHYEADYDDATELPIVPLHGGTYAAPRACFTESSPWPEVFPLADVRAIGGEESCTALRLPQRPPIDTVVKQLLGAPPSDKLADRVFEYMQRRASEVSHEAALFLILLLACASTHAHVHTHTQRHTCTCSTHACTAISHICS